VAPQFCYVEKGGEKVHLYSDHFGHGNLALSAFAVQHMQAQVEVLYNFSIQLDLYGPNLTR
jgi:hypothetical protein